MDDSLLEAQFLTGGARSRNFLLGWRHSKKFKVSHPLTHSRANGIIIAIIERKEVTR